MLRARSAADAGVQILVNASAEEVRSDNGFTLKAAPEPSVSCGCAGLWQTGGAFPIQRWAATRIRPMIWRGKSALALWKCRPALVPFTMNPEDRERYWRTWREECRSERPVFSTCRGHDAGRFARSFS